MSIKRLVGLISFVLAGLLLQWSLFSYSNSKEKQITWHKQILTIGNVKFSISLPNNESKDFIIKPVLSKVVSSDDRFNGDGRYVGMVEKYWDIKDGLYGSVYGTLKLKLGVKRKAYNFDGDINEVAVLDSYISNTNISSPSYYYSNQRRIQIGNINWIFYAVTGQTDSVNYVVAVSESHYLLVQLSYINNTHDVSLRWPEDARNLAANIVKSIKKHLISN